MFTAFNERNDFSYAFVMLLKKSVMRFPRQEKIIFMLQQN